jgi:uncharacterized protein
VEFEWDRRKAISNLKTHGVDLADAVTVFDDDLAVTMPDEHPEEQRFITLGMDALGRVLVVVYGWRGDRIRIISARKATPRERQYGG